MLRWPDFDLLQTELQQQHPPVVSRRLGSRELPPGKALAFWGTQAVSVAAPVVPPAGCTFAADTLAADTLHAVGKVVAGTSVVDAPVGNVAAGRVDTMVAGRAAVQRQAEGGLPDISAVLEHGLSGTAGLKALTQQEMASAFLGDRAQTLALVAEKAYRFGLREVGKADL